MALSFDPLYPVAGTETELSLSTGSTTGNVVVWELTSKPARSALTLGFISKPGTFRRQKLATPIRTTTATTATTTTHRTTPVTALAVAEAEAEYAFLTPDVAGEYGLTAWEVFAYAAAPQYAGDPQGEMRWTFAAKQTGTLHVGELMDLPVLTEGGEGGTLRLTVVDETVRAAEIVNTTGEVGRLAALESATVAALAALVDVAVSTVGTDLQTGVNDLRSKFTDHIASAVWHSAADTVNAIVRAYNTGSQRAAIDTLNEARDRYLGHTQQTSNAVTRVHENDDYVNVPIAARAKDLASATVLSADLRERCYERHRTRGSGASPPVHTTVGADVTNTLAAPSLLDDFIVAYLDAMVIVDPTIASGEPEGAGDAAARFGFRPAA